MKNLRNFAIAFVAPLPSIVFYLTFLRHQHRFSTSSSASSSAVSTIFGNGVPTILSYSPTSSSSSTSTSSSGSSAFSSLITGYESSPLVYAAPSSKSFDFSSSIMIFGYLLQMIDLYWTVIPILLIGICLPMYAIHSSKKPWGFWDFIATSACFSGISIAFFADTQLNNFMQRNEILKHKGARLVPNLNEGLWYYSRHPNYFGEQLWWWGLFVFAWNVGYGWMFVGPLANSLCLAYVTVLVERRMLKREDRADAYMHYRKTTSVWIPWFKLAIEETKERKL
ncbi:hypothetical protein KSP40_PGU006467 [Platanthera guangdongensis]|uniref:Steroid 5-alpha reductase C-terminal domain-containing protein n=1 Tax=Platanthera guangdongensis TaxID=2320717 RepID=A0ABR2LP46_9ASPA